MSHALIIAGRYMYTGTAKFTRKSVDNEQLTCKITGPPVEEVLEKFAGNRLAGRASLQQPLCFHVGGQENKRASFCCHLPTGLNKKW